MGTVLTTPRGVFWDEVLPDKSLVVAVFNYRGGARDLAP